MNKIRAVNSAYNGEESVSTPYHPYNLLPAYVLGKLVCESDVTGTSFPASVVAVQLIVSLMIPPENPVGVDSSLFHRHAPLQAVVSGTRKMVYRRSVHIVVSIFVPSSPQASLRL